MDLKINRNEFTKETYVEFCRLYLNDKFYKEVPITCPLEYRHISKLINTISSTMFMDIRTETTQLVLINKIYSLFLSIGVEYSKEFIHNCIIHLINNYPTNLKE